MTEPDARPLPPPGGHYRHAVRRGNLVFAAGQVGWDDDRQFVEGIAAQTRRALENLGRALASEGATLEDLVTVNVFLADLADFPGYDAAYREMIPADPPARTSVGARLFPGCLVEINGIAVLA